MKLIERARRTDRAGSKLNGEKRPAAAAASSRLKIMAIVAPPDEGIPCGPDEHLVIMPLAGSVQFLSVLAVEHMKCAATWEYRMVREEER